MSGKGIEAIVIGASAGAIQALSRILPALPEGYPIPVLVVVHIPADRSDLLASLFQAKCRLAVKEAEDKEPIRAGTIYFAPPDYHVLVEQDRRLSLSSDEPVSYSRPAVDVLFETAADAYGPGLIGDIDTLTVCEYLALSRWGRLRYRLYRHPIVMFGIGPAFLFILQHRLPVGLMRRGWQPWLSTMATNAAIAAVIGTLIWFIGIGSFLLVHLPIMLLAASIGVWLFYVQHQFEQTSWDRHEDWTLQAAALHGSSHYDLPGFLRWLTANIGLHHVHHLNSRIPFYRLPRVLRDYPELRDVGRLTLTQSLRCVPLVLWDERRRRLVSFREIQSGNICTLD